VFFAIAAVAAASSPLAGHVANGDAHGPVRRLEHVVEVPADPRGLGRRTVQARELDARQALGQGEHRLLQRVSHGPLALEELGVVERQRDRGGHVRRELDLGGSERDRRGVVVHEHDADDAALHDQRHGEDRPYRVPLHHRAVDPRIVVRVVDRDGCGSLKGDRGMRRLLVGQHDPDDLGGEAVRIPGDPGAVLPHDDRCRLGADRVAGLADRRPHDLVDLEGRADDRADAYQRGAHEGRVAQAAVGLLERGHVVERNDRADDPPVLEQRRGGGEHGRHAPAR
jgi:hypothetical protein